ncbi:MAG TPA: tetraacyldisaccharide 4'-kinase, partial [Candidatus Krumholzibacteria bacterium]|nr:tetraacyldisaccharide 4'-kinase [Candidatus Krumholzibacteria bacterium]
EAAYVKPTTHEVFPDHHRYTVKDIAYLAAVVRHAGASCVVTTEKDWMKLREFELPFGVWVARLDVSVTGDELPV